MTIQLEEKLFIGGKVCHGLALSGTIDAYSISAHWRERERIVIVNPATKQQIASVHAAGAKEVDAAVDAAEKAWPAWADCDAASRAKAFNKLGDLVDEHADRLGTVQSMEMGKPVAQSMYVFPTPVLTVGAWFGERNAVANFIMLHISFGTLPA